jgi:hypothetical protein
MARMTKVGVGYNIQLAVDVKHKLIAKQAVSNQVLDLGLLAQIATAAMEVLGVERIEAVADRGYGLCAKANPRSRRARGLLRQGRVPLRARPRRLRLPGSGNALAAVQGQVTLKSRCTQSFRRVSRLENEAVLDRMAARLALRTDVLDHRRNSVDHSFGTIKQWMGQGTFLMRRLENVRGKFSLTRITGI